MNRGLRVRNWLQLKEYARIVPIAEHLVQILAAGAKTRATCNKEVSANDGEGRWLIAHDSAERGFAVCVQDVAQTSTPYRWRVEYVRCAEILAQAFPLNEEDPLIIVARSLPPVSWHRFLVSVRGGTIRCALASDIPPLRAMGCLAPCVSKMVRVPLVGYVKSEAGLQWHEPRLVSALDVKAPCIGFVGQLRMNREGVVVMETKQEEEATESEALIPLRIELGEIELSVAELAALRVGTPIELDAPLPLRCFINIGMTTFAEGTLLIGEEGCSVRVEKILDS